MGLETGTTIASLNASWPLGTDPKSQGDDHLRLIKAVMKADVVPKSTGGTFDGEVAAAGYVTSVQVASGNVHFRAKWSNGNNAGLVYWDPAGGSVWNVNNSAGAAVNAVTMSAAGLLLTAGQYKGPGTNNAAQIGSELGGYVTIGYDGTGGYGRIRYDGSTLIKVANSINARNFNLAASGGPISVALNLNDSAGTLFAIYCDTTSDARVKENVAPTDVDGLAVINALRLVQHDFTDAYMRTRIGDTFGGRTEAEALAADRHVEISVIAQELEAIVPSAVTTSQQTNPLLPPDMKSISPQALVLYLAKAVQELSAKVEALEAR